MRGRLLVDEHLSEDGITMRSATMACTIDALLAAVSDTPDMQVVTETVTTHSAPARAGRTLELTAWTERNGGARFVAHVTVRDGDVVVATTRATMLSFPSV